jgi:hypothetical protein
VTLALPSRVGPASKDCVSFFPMNPAARLAGVIAMTDRSSLTKEQTEKLIAQRRAYRDSMRCRGVRVEVIGRVELFAHAKATTLWRALKQYGDLGEGACGCEDVVNAPFLAFMRRRAKWDSDTFVLGICAGCAARPDLRGKITRAMREYFVCNDLLDHFVTQVVLPAELDEAAP